MGRVSKHKRIKAIDPFYKGPRRDQSRQDNLPPGSSADEQPVPKSLLRIIRSSTSQNKKSPISRNSHSKAATSDSEKLAAFTAKHEEDDQSFLRRKGESLNDFLDRIEVKSREQLVELSKKSKGKSERRTKYYEKRKRRLASKKGRKQESEEIVEFKDLKDTVHFGEVVSAPPRLSAKPRGKATKAVIVPTGKSPHSFHESEEKVPVVVGLKRKQDLEEERERIITEYRLNKKAKSNRISQLTL